MKRFLVAAASLAVCSYALAFTVTANLVSQRVGSSVTGQPVRICIYSYNGHNYEQAIPMMESCAYSIQLQ